MARSVRGFGPGERTAGGRYVMDGGRLMPVEQAGGRARETIRAADNEEMRSGKCGCVLPAEQKRRAAKLARLGVKNPRYDQRTGELVYEGGYQAQKIVARMHGLEVD